MPAEAPVVASAPPAPPPPPQQPAPVAAPPPVAVTAVGGSGTVRGVTLGDGEEDDPVPAAFEAATVKVYDVPFVRPFTKQVVAPVVVQGIQRLQDGMPVRVTLEPPSAPSSPGTADGGETR